MSYKSAICSGVYQRILKFRNYVRGGDHGLHVCLQVLVSQCHIKAVRGADTHFASLGNCK